MIAWAIEPEPTAAPLQVSPETRLLVVGDNAMRPRLLRAARELPGLGLKPVGWVAVDGDEVALGGATVTINDKTKAVGDISWSASLYVPYGATLKIAVPGTLAAGEHTLTMQINVPELGRISIPITDALS